MSLIDYTDKELLSELLRRGRIKVAETCETMHPMDYQMRSTGEHGEQFLDQMNRVLARNIADYLVDEKVIKATRQPSPPIKEEEGLLWAAPTVLRAELAVILPKE